jgi:thiol-disulfide isomerase/thioredoxin
MSKGMIVLSIIVLALAAGCTDKSAQSNFPAVTDFTLQDMRGRSVRLSDFKGKVVLLEFWATWCPPCGPAVPVLERLHKTYRNKGLVVLAVSLDMGGWDALPPYINSNGITYRVLKGTSAVAIQYQVRSIPVFLVLNKKGKIVKRYFGLGGDEELEKDIKTYL